ncbi:hypothetical protein WJX73_002582 [Symbiochloris irregularis]|uniref:CSE family protein n=1 Tax=Symbiochloris irregularis TaxID=706552 RepID=A0AAW1NRZ9_9CHLO
MGEDNRGVRLPPELQHVPGRVLEEYVRARLIQFAGAFARRVSPALGQSSVQQAAADAISSLPLPELGGVAVENRDLQLVFRHDCLSLGCLDMQCVLCEHNPQRRCNVNFAPKYLVNDPLKAKCEAPIRIEVIDRATGVPVGEDIPDMHLEMSILDGNAYDTKCTETGSEHDDDLDACSLFVNNRTQPLLAPGTAAAANNSSSRVVAPLTRGMAQLPDLHVTDSSEAMLSGRKPPFRLLVRAVATDGRPISVRHAVSEGFVVATRRTRTAGKVEIPNVDDHVSKLEHMGKETVKKLQDLRNAAAQAGLEIIVPDNCITKVGQFRKLSLLAEADGHLRQKLQQLLKLSKEKLGNVDLERPVGLLQKRSQDGAQTTMEATLTGQQTPAQREQVRQLQPSSVSSWWHSGHPGWAIYPVDSESFMATGAIENANLQHEHILAPPLPPSPSHDGSPRGYRDDPSRAVSPMPSFPSFLDPPTSNPAASDRTRDKHETPSYSHGHRSHADGSVGVPVHGGGPASGEDDSDAEQRGPARTRLKIEARDQRGVPNTRYKSSQHDSDYSSGPSPPPSAFGGASIQPPQAHATSLSPSHIPSHTPASLNLDPLQAPSPFAAAQHPSTHPHTHNLPAGTLALPAQLNLNNLNAPQNTLPGPHLNAHPMRQQQPGQFLNAPQQGGANVGPPGASGAVEGGLGGAGPSTGNLSNLAAIFSGPFSSTELSKLQSVNGLNLSNFPSLPQAMLSGDLEAFLQQHHVGEGQLSPGVMHESPFGRGGMSGHIRSYSIGKLESLELPDASAAIAMLHDMSPEARAQATGQLHTANSMGGRTNSGLQSMQSIEHALGTVEHDMMDKVTDEWMAQHGGTGAPPGGSHGGNRQGEGPTGGNRHAGAPQQHHQQQQPQHLMQMRQ